MMMRSLTLKLMLAFLAVSLVGICLIAIFASRVTAVAFGNFVDEQNQTLIADQLADYYEIHNGWGGARLPTPRFIGGRGPGGGFGTDRHPFVVADARGKVLLPGGGGRHPGDILPAEFLAGGIPVVVNDEVVGYLILPEEVERQQFRTNFVQRVNQTLLLAAVAAVTVSLLLGIILSRSLTRPLQELTNATQKVAQGDLSQQVPVRSEDELGRLAASFNQMSYQLAHSQGLRRQMTADIAHDLRTPLAIILGHTEALRDGVLPPEQQTFEIIYDEAQRLNRLVEDLRTLSLAEAGKLHMTMRLISPKMLLERAYLAHMPRAQEKQIALELHSSAELASIEVDPDRMAQVLDNLLSNALQYTPENGRVTLSATQTDKSVSLTVQDSGPGMTAEELAHVFDRFYRGDSARQRQPDGGSGLGLAIARSLVRAQNGRVTVRSEPDQGAVFVVEFPVGNEN
ncbi:MAG: HAMP domain-containing protein [Chloroflexi bacterium]|nr:HAMP domain-containing protein [Chloroflexota bacterium]